MISLRKAMTDKKFDTRLIDFMIQTGKLSQSEVDTYLKSLPDSEANSMALVIDETPEPSSAAQ